MRVGTKVVPSLLSMFGTHALKLGLESYSKFHSLKLVNPL